MGKVSVDASGRKEGGRREGKQTDQVGRAGVWLEVEGRPSQSDGHRVVAANPSEKTQPGEDERDGREEVEWKRRERRERMDGQAA